MQDYTPDDEDMESPENDILTEAKKRYQIASEAWNEYRHTANDTLKFVAGEQWDNQLKMNRTNAGLPSLTANKLKSFLRQITNEARQNTPSIQIDPRDNLESEEKAKVLSGLIRTIENESNADTAYDTACEYAASVGLGYFRLISEYVSDDSMQQKLVIKAIDDPNTVLIDPTHRDKAGADMSYAFLITKLSKEDYLRLYPDSKMANSVTTTGWSDVDNIWVSEHDVLIAEYYYKDWKEKTLYETINTLTGERDTTFYVDKKSVKEGFLKILKDRKVQIPMIRWCKLNDVEILEETEWPGPFIPVIPVKGNETWVDGKRIISGACQDAIDSQRAFNYFFSLQAELVQLAPKAPFIGEIRQFANFEKLWRDANVAPNAYLPYNAISLDGQPLPAPQRQSVEVPIQAAGSLCAQAADNLKSIFGIFDASLGAQGNETSGKAILARQQQSHTTNYHFYDNLIRSITHLGRCILAAIPVFYDDERIVQITDVAGNKKPVMINGQDPKNGEFYDMTKGKFDVVIQTGASYSTRREEAATSMMALGQVYPEAMPIISDIMVRNMDWPGAKEVAARLHAAVPPEILQATDGEEDMQPETVVIQLKKQLQQQGEQLKALNAHAKNTEDELKIAHQELALSKMDKTIQLKKAEMDYNTDSRKLDIQEQTAAIQAMLDTEKLRIASEQLQLEKEQLMADIASDVMDHGHKKAKSNSLDRSSEIRNVISTSEIANPNINDDLGSGKIN